MHCISFVNGEMIKVFLLTYYEQMLIIMHVKTQEVQMYKLFS